MSKLVAILKETLAMKRALLAVEKSVETVKKTADKALSARPPHDHLRWSTSLLVG